MNRNRWLALGVLAAIACGGCRGTPESDPQQSMTTVNIHINGFKKSKSGAT